MEGPCCCWWRWGQVCTVGPLPLQGDVGPAAGKLGRALLCCQLPFSPPPTVVSFYPSSNPQLLQQSDLASFLGPEPALLQLPSCCPTTLSPRPVIWVTPTGLCGVGNETRISYMQGNGLNSCAVSPTLFLNSKSSTFLSCFVLQWV